MYASAPHALSPDKSRKKSKYRNTPKDGRDDIYLDSRVIANRSLPPGKVSQNSKSIELPPNSLKKSSTGKSRTLSRAPSRLSDYLEELMDKPIEVDDEVDLVFTAKPTSAKFVKAKANVDSATQIEKTDFFEFDVEVEPFLEVLVGKTLHLSVIELKEEFELETIRKQQEEFEAIRNMELVELHRLEVEHKRKAAERERREKQESSIKEQQVKKKDNTIARQVANSIIAVIDERLFDSLERRGNFENKIEKEIREVSLKEVRQKVLARVQLYAAAKDMAEELLLAAMRKGEVFGALQMKECEKQEQERRRKAEEEAARKKAEAEAAAAAALAAAEKARLEEEGSIGGEME